MAETRQAKAFLRAFGDELRQARRLRGWTRKDLHARLVSDVSLQTIATYELGTRQCPLLRFLELARVLDVPAPDLLTRALARATPRTDDDRLVIDLVRISHDTTAALRPLRRWARHRLNQKAPGDSTVVRLDPPAVECLAELCRIDTVELIRVIR